MIRNYGPPLKGYTPKERVPFWPPELEMVQFMARNHIWVRDSEDNLLRSLVSEPDKGITPRQRLWLWTIAAKLISKFPEETQQMIAAFESIIDIQNQMLQGEIKHSILLEIADHIKPGLQRVIDEWIATSATEGGNND